MITMSQKRAADNLVARLSKPPERSRTLDHYVSRLQSQSAVQVVWVIPNVSRSQPTDSGIVKVYCYPNNVLCSSFKHLYPFNTV